MNSGLRAANWIEGCNWTDQDVTGQRSLGLGKRRSGKSVGFSVNSGLRFLKCKFRKYV